MYALDPDGFVEKLIHSQTGMVFVTAPPRGGLSTMCYRLMADWMSRADGRRMLFVDYDDEFAKMAWRMAVEEAGPDADHASVEAAGVGAALCGHSYDFILVNTLIKNTEEAFSEPLNNRLTEWVSALRCRLNPDGTTVIGASRWQPNDYVARLMRLQGEPYIDIHVPALATWLSSEKMGDVLDKTKAALHPSMWDALYAGVPG